MIRLLRRARAAAARALLGVSAEEIRYTFEDVRSELRATRAELRDELSAIRRELERLDPRAGPGPAAGDVRGDGERRPRAARER